MSQPSLVGPFVVALAMGWLPGSSGLAAAAEAVAWRESLWAGDPARPLEAINRAARSLPERHQPLEIVADWLAQDLPEEDASWRAAFESALDAPDSWAEPYQGRARSLAEGDVAKNDRRWSELYLDACEARRAARFRPHQKKLRRIVFTKHYDLGGSHYAYTEGQSDAQRERHFRAGAALCILERDGIYGATHTLIEDPQGVIRDPDVSFDGKRILFAWKKSDREDDYHLYEWDVESAEVRRLTGGLGFADYEGCYLPDGNILFNSTRCVQTVDCWWTEVSNLFVCDGNGKYLRQVGFDQVHTNYPTVTCDGRVIYTRWDYNDRGQIYPQGLFQMAPDGTGQTEVYGNNSFFPTTILHARSIPGTGKIVCIFTGHHTRQQGWLGILEPRRGRQENEGAQLIAPVRETPAAKIDRYGQDGDQFQYPYPLSETEFLVTFREQDAPRFAIYWMDIDGNRELLASDPRISCNQPVPLCPRPLPTVQPNRTDYREELATVYLHDVYAGPGLAGVERDTIKGLRVVGLDFRAAGVGSNSNRGPAGGALVSTPISIQGAWDVKQLLGTAEVHDDGSACFTVPARTPLYFQALDEKGQMVQTMRSWVTLQPGETFSCVGCHEPKNTAPPYTAYSQAMRRGPRPLAPFYGPPRGFSFIREIQPILDKHCVRCHYETDKRPSYGSLAELGDKRGRIPAAASHAHAGDAVSALSDGLEPKDSNDHGIPRFTWWSHRGTEEWVEYQFETPRRVSGVDVYWFDDEARGGQCRVPASWRLVYRDGKQWKPVEKPSNYGTIRDRYNCVSFAPVTTTGLRIEAQLQERFSGGILEWKLEPEEAVAAAGVARAVKPPAGVEPAFSLKGIQTLDSKSARKWSDSYVALANRQVCDWINAQSAPPMLPPYSAGASQSKLVRVLEDGSHYGVKLSKPELDRFIVWIDVLVPYAGDYTEAMDENQIPKYNHFLEKRRHWHAEEAANIAALLQKR